MHKYTKDNIITCVFCYLALSLFIVVSPVIFIITIIFVPFFETYQRLFNKECESMETSTNNLRKFEQHAYDNFINKNPSIKYSIYEELVKVNYLDLQEAYIRDIHFEQDNHSEIQNINTNINANTRSKQPLLVIHGANSGAPVFLPIIQRLINEGYDVHSISLPGFGLNPINGNAFEDMTSTQIVNFYVLFFGIYLDKIFPERRPVIVGHSFGGFLSTKIAFHHPDKIRGIMLINPVGIFPFLGSLGTYWAIIFKSGFPNRFARKVGRLLNPLLLGRDNEENIKIAQMTCRDNYGDIIVSKFITFDWFCSYWNIPIFFDILRVQKPLAIVVSDGDNIIPSYQSDVISMVCKHLDKPMSLFTIQGWHYVVSDEISVSVILEGLRYIDSSSKDPYLFKNTKELDTSHEESIANLFNQYGYALYSREETRQLIKFIVNKLFTILDMDLPEGYIDRLNIL